MVAWDVAEVESAEIAAELVQRACLKERYCRPRGFGSRQSQQQPLILHADNGNAVAAGCDDPGNPRSSGLTLRRPTRLPVVVFRKICRPGLMGPISKEASDLIRAWSRGPITVLSGFSADRSFPTTIKKRWHHQHWHRSARAEQLTS